MHPSLGTLKESKDAAVLLQAHVHTYFILAVIANRHDEEGEFERLNNPSRQSDKNLILCLFFLINIDHLEPVMELFRIIRETLT